MDYNTERSMRSVGAGRADEDKKGTIHSKRKWTTRGVAEPGGGSGQPLSGTKMDESASYPTLLSRGRNCVSLREPRRDEDKA